MTRHATTALLLAALLALTLAGCRATRDSGRALYELQANADPAAAWSMARESARASAPARDDDACRDQSTLLHVLADAPGVAREADTEARTALGYLQNHCGETRWSATGQAHMARYLLHTGRPGAGLPLAEAALESAVGLRDQAGAHLLLAELLDEMGMAHQRDAHALTAQERMAEHLAGLDRDTPSVQTGADLQLFQSILLRRLDFLARTPGANRASAMDRLWAECLRLDALVTAPGERHALFLHGVHAFSRSGRADRARALLRDMAAHARAADAPDRARHALLLAEARVLSAEADHSGAAALYARARQRGQPSVRDALEEGLACLRAGLAHRADAVLTRLAGLLEERRGSFGVQRRERYLSDEKARIFQGLVLARARRWLEAPGPEALDRALAAATAFRARQMGDLLELDGTDVQAAALSRALGTDELLLHWVAGDEQSVLFILSSREGRLVLLDSGRQELERMTAELRDAVASRDRARGEPAATALGRAVLGPAAAEVAAHRRLLLVPDGALSLAPLGLLSMQEPFRPLLFDHVLAQPPSLSFLLAARAPGPLQPLSALLLADPDYAGVHPPLRPATRGVQIAGAQGQSLFAPLPETRDEARAVADLLGTSRALTLLGPEAGRSALLAAEPGARDLLHFATHGILGGTVPGVYEPALVLSASRGQDPFLRASEIAALDLDADLVVLSACDTGRGEMLAGEGVLGLARSFLLAGGRSVVATLWPVVSDPTVALMRDFYTHLLAGEEPAAAMRRAQLDLAGRPGTASPLFWAGFAYVGR